MNSEELQEFDKYNRTQSDMWTMSHLCYVIALVTVAVVLIIELVSKSIISIIHKFFKSTICKKEMYAFRINLPSLYFTYFHSHILCHTM